MSPDLSRAAWRKSNRSQQQSACVELAALPGAVAVRDSKNPAGPALVLRPAALARLLGEVKAGTLDL